MLGTQPKCPNMVNRVYPGRSFPSDKSACGYGGFKILEEGIFTRESGFDPLASKVRCRECGQEYYIFPSIKFKEEKYD